MKANVKRIKKEVEMLLINNKTIREIAKCCNISKSTVHKDLSERLPKIDLELSKKVKNILLKHKKAGYLKGGEVTKNKYKKFEETLCIINIEQ